MGRVVAPAHLGVVVQLHLQVLSAGDGDVGAQHRKIPVGRTGQKVKAVARLTEVGVQGVAGVAVLVLIEAVYLGGHRYVVPLHGQGDLAAHPGLQRLGVLGAHRQV